MTFVGQEMKYHERNAAFNALRGFGSLGGLELKLGGKCFEHSVGSEIFEFPAEVKLPESSEFTSQQSMPISLSLH